MVDGYNGFLAEIDDVEKLTEGLLRVLRQSREDWRTMSEAAYATVQQFTWERAAESFETALHRAVRQSAQLHLIGVNS